LLVVVTSLLDVRLTPVRREQMSTSSLISASQRCLNTGNTINGYNAFGWLHVDHSCSSYFSVLPRDAARL